MSFNYRLAPLLRVKAAGLPALQAELAEAHMACVNIEAACASARSALQDCKQASFVGS